MTRIVESSDGPIEWQQAALRQEGVPSCTGVENAASIGKAVPHAIELGVLRPDTLVRTATGELLARHSVPGDLATYLTPAPLRYLVAEILDSSDADVIVRAWPLLPGEFHYHDSTMQALARDLLRRLAQTAPSDRRAEELLSQMEGGHIRRVARETQRRLYEDFWIARLEFLVDLGLLSKPACDSYSYRKRLGSEGSTIVESLQASSINPEEAVADIRDAYDTLKTRVGFAPIRECLLLANMRRVEAGLPVMRVTEADRWLRERTRGGALSVRLVLDRDGRAGSFKILEDQGG